MSKQITKSIDDIRFVKELYPRLKEDDAAIARYQAAIDQLPPIVVARGGVLVDGFHRWQAHRRENRKEIIAEDLGNIADAEIVRESIRRNATHGQQLSQADKRRLAGELWLKHFAAMPNGERTREIAGLLSVSDKSVERWTKDARRHEREQQQARVWDLWLNCRSTREIEAETGIERATVHDWVSEKRQLSEFGHPPASRQHFDIWEFPRADGDSGYFGKMPPQVVENLLWFYTEPGDIVVDPMVGGGTTIEVAKAMGRRVWASDLHPSTPLLPIHEHDICSGWPDGAPDQANLILLDPPYWRQAKGQYGDGEHNLAEVELPEFEKLWHKIVDVCAGHLAQNGRLCYIVSPTQLDKDCDHRVIDHATDMLAACWAAGLVIERRIIVPYQTQQASQFDVTWARDNKHLLKRYRDLVVLRHA